LQYELHVQGAKATITTNILKISKLMEIHLITKNTQCVHHSPSRTYGQRTCL